MHAQLAAIDRDLEAVTSRFRRLLDATPDARWGVRADPARWSVAECVAHLNLTSAAMVPRLRTAWEEARALGGGAPARFRRSPMGFVLSKTVGPLPGWGRTRFGRVRTAAAFVPTGDLPRARLTAEFAEWQRAQHELVREADTLPVDRVTIESPFVPGTRYDGYSSLVILVRHAHRHLAQAEQVWMGR